MRAKYITTKHYEHTNITQTRNVCALNILEKHTNTHTIEKTRQQRHEDRIGERERERDSYKIIINIPRDERV